MRADSTKKDLLHIKVGEILSVKKGVLKSPQAFQNPKLKIIFPLMMRKANAARIQIVPLQKRQLRRFLRSCLLHFVVADTLYWMLVTG